MTSETSVSKSAVSYSDARAHYLSPRRRDPVKTMSEEPISHRIIANAVDLIERAPDAPIRVLDVGSGTGDGFALLTESHGRMRPVVDGSLCRYVGLDVDADMITTAAATCSSPNASFVISDVRNELPNDDFDLYLSCGVPYSHLTTVELHSVLTGLFRRIADQGRRAVVVIDVLGRYSVEWTPNWDRPRWDYSMSFFEDSKECIEDPMSFYDQESLDHVITDAGEKANVAFPHKSYADRSVLVGRHTATRTFNPAIPAFRTLINSLVTYTDGPVEARQLRFAPPRAGAPDKVLEFFAHYAQRWNAIVDTYDNGRRLDHEQSELFAQELLDCERQERKGLGAGHSLTATVLIDAS